MADTRNRGIVTRAHGIAIFEREIARLHRVTGRLGRAMAVPGRAIELPDKAVLMSATGRLARGLQAHPRESGAIANPASVVGRANNSQRFA